jgi:pyruvate kinase
VVPRPGRIMVTLGIEAADEPYFITRLVQQADVVRINCAHDDENVWAHMIAHARTAEQKLGRRICILMDIAGPKSAPWM